MQINLLYKVKSQTHSTIQCIKMFSYPHVWKRYPVCIPLHPIYILHMLYCIIKHILYRHFVSECRHPHGYRLDIVEGGRVHHLPAIRRSSYVRGQMWVAKNPTIRYKTKRPSYTSARGLSMVTWKQVIAQVVCLNRNCKSVFWHQGEAIWPGRCLVIKEKYGRTVLLGHRSALTFLTRISWQQAKSHCQLTWQS